MRTRKGRKVTRHKTRILVNFDEIRKQVNRAYGLPDYLNLLDPMEFEQSVTRRIESYAEILNLMATHTGRRC